MQKTITPWGIQCKMQMIALGKSLTDLSRETGFSRTYVSAIINGRVKAPKETKAKIGKCLSVNDKFVLSE